MSLSPRSLRRAMVLLLLMAGGTCGWAANRALLVGVSELVNQPSSLWLQAPRNDVLLMRQVLQKRGFAASDITVLADGVAGAELPEAQRIHAALARLLAQSRSGDFVLLYFSGHGTRLRDVTKLYQEPDGLAENFLARDVRGVLGAGGGGGTSLSLSGGLRDVDVDAWVRAFLARDVFVWSVFDTCSATSMTRGAGAAAGATAMVDGPRDDEVRWRGLRPAQLRASGVAPAPPAGAGASAIPSASAPPASASLPAPPSTAAVSAPPAAPSVPRARYVAFFASESHQVTPELRLPRNDRAGQPQGLLTWALADALARRPATWRELFEGVLALYPGVIGELSQRFPTRELPSPVAEGNLDAPLFSNRMPVAVTRPTWKAQRAGDMLALAAGQLDGLSALQEVRVQATLEDGTRRSVAAKLARADLDAASLPVPTVLRELPGTASWSVTPSTEPSAIALRVRTAARLPAGISLSYPASVVAVGAASSGGGEADAGADLSWTDLGAAGHRLDGLSESGLGATASETLPDLPAVRRRLESLARLKWFVQLDRLAQGGRLDGFEAAFEVWRGDSLLRTEALRRMATDPAAGALLPLADGERAALQVRNAAGASLDMVVVGLDAAGRLHAVYPDDAGETNRFERGTREAPAVKRFELPWFDGPGARLFVLALPATPYRGPRLFGAEPTEPGPDIVVRGQLRPPAGRPVHAALVRWPGEPVSRTR
ncbi:MAG: caspase family protein [Comamonadaceae bacterium]|nr:MAG: caspase family protein [Comamonadaceae bacterium]